MLSRGDPVENFRDAVLLNSDSQDSVTSYVKVLNWFCADFKITPRELVEASSKGEFRPDLECAAWIRSKRNLAPGTRRVYRAAMRKFFETNLPDMDFRWDRVQVGKMRILEMDRAPTKDELLKMLSVATLKGRVVIAFLTSSGVRRGTLAKLRLKDLDLDKYPDVGVVRVPSEANKSRFPFVTFISPQAKGLLREYLREREAGVRRPPEKITPESPVIARAGKAVRSVAISELWRRTLDRAGLGETPRRFRTLRAHVARKFFATQLTACGTHVSVRERLLGHSGSGNPGTSLDTAYFKPDETLLLDAYRKAIPNLTIIDENQDRVSRREMYLTMGRTYGLDEEQLEEVGRIFDRETNKKEAEDQIIRVFRANIPFKELLRRRDEEQARRKAEQ